MPPQNQSVFNLADITLIMQGGGWAERGLLQTRTSHTLETFVAGCMAPGITAQLPSPVCCGLEPDEDSPGHAKPTPPLHKP